MAGARVYPKANTTAQWFEAKYTRKTMSPVIKLLLHTTETTGWPAYDGGSSAPTITYHPWLPAGQRWRQHCYIDRSARALRDPSGTAVRENQDGVVQVEIICYCDPKLYAKYGKGVNKLPDSFYEDMGAFLAFLHTEYAVPLVRAPRWDTFPPSDSIRMSGPEYDAFRGVLGHQHASGNTHGDPGMTNAQVDRILTVAKRITAGPTTPAKPPVQEDDMSAADVALINGYTKIVCEHLKDNFRQVLATAVDGLTDHIDARFAASVSGDEADEARVDATLADLKAMVTELRDNLPEVPEPPKA